MWDILLLLSPSNTIFLIGHAPFSEFENCKFFAELHDFQLEPPDIFCSQFATNEDLKS